MRRRVYLAFLWCLPLILAGQESWQTYYEQSGYLRTPRYTETMDFCRRLANASPVITMGTFGKSAQGRDLVYLVADRDGLSDPSSIRARGRMVVLVQACIHPGESEGKDAGLMLYRDIAIPSGRDNGPADLLDRISILFIPIFNADGHERFGPYNRINQNGPEEMGWRVTATNLNLNRDFLKADTPEMQAWLRLFSKWLPEFFIDTHTTDGADYQYALTYLVEVFGNMDEGLTRWAKDKYVPLMEKRMAGAGFPVFPYVDFRNWHDPRSGLVSEVSPPMLSQAYTALHNRPGLLIETHMLKPYNIRVSSTYACIRTTLDILHEQASALKNLENGADAFTASPAFRTQPFPLQFRVSETDSVMVPFLGIGYSLKQSTVSGGSWFDYNGQPEMMTLPWFNRNQPSFSVVLPVAYIIPPEWQEVIARLDLHGISMTTLKKEVNVPVSSYRFKNPKWQSNPYEGRHPLTQVQYDETAGSRTFPAGSVIVLTSQPAARIIAHILEPRGNGSYTWWGFFDAVFEQKEYGENYVLEKMAAEMLSEDPSLAEEFAAKKASDSVFAKSPQQILNWFYSKSPYFDRNRNLYPVGRIMDQHTLNEILRD